MLNDSLISAFRSIWANKMRSFLTLLGIVIGIYTVVTLLAVATGLQKQIADQVEGLGPRTMIILPGETEAGAATPNFAAQLAPSTLKSTDVTLLKEKADLIDPETIDYAIILGGTLHKGDNKATVLPMGATPGVAANLGYEKIAAGREMTAEDMTNKAKIILMNKASATKLAAIVGDTVSLGKENLVLTGIYDDPETSGLSPADSQNAALLPVTVAEEINGSNQINRIIAKAKDVSQVDAAKTQVTKIIGDAHGTTDFTVLLSSDLLKSVTSITDMLKYAVVGIAAISLLVAGIGISNIMLVTVTERTREIGIRKAVGATETAILTQFLIEAVVLTVSGSIIGLGLASLSSIAAAKFSPLDPVITWQTVALAVGMGVLSGVVFGLFPAIRAARKNPVEALRFE